MRLLSTTSSNQPASQRPTDTAAAATAFRTGPPGTQLHHLLGYYPSVHTATALVCTGLLLRFTRRLHPHWRPRLLAASTDWTRSCLLAASTDWDGRGSGWLAAAGGPVGPIHRVIRSCGRLRQWNNCSGRVGESEVSTMGGPGCYVRLTSVAGNRPRCSSPTPVDHCSTPASRASRARSRPAPAVDRGLAGDGRGCQDERSVKINDGE